MKLLFYYFLIILTLNSCNKKNNHFAIVVHGGAGTILKDNMTNEMEKAYKQKLEEALNIGYSILKQNGKSVDAVEATIKILEDSELFNAGKGSVLSNNELATGGIVAIIPMPNIPAPASPAVNWPITCALASGGSIFK